MINRGTIMNWEKIQGNATEPKNSNHKRKTSYWSKYKTLRNKVTNMKKHAKIIFFNNLEESLTTLQSNNQKQYWQTVKLLIKGNKSSDQNIPPLQNNDQSFSLTDEDEGKYVKLVFFFNIFA